MRTEISRTREHGTVVTQTEDHLAKVEAIRAILTNGYAKVNGVMVDHFSASAIIAVYDAISDANKAKYRAFPIYKMADIAFKLMNKVA
jgi:hypothetical protein